MANVRSILNVPAKELDFKVPHLLVEGTVPNKIPAYDKQTHSDGIPITWMENKPFKAAYKFLSIEAKSGSNLAHVLFEDTGTGVRRRMCQRDFECLIRRVPAIDGVFVGEWRFRKKKDEDTITIVLNE